MYNCVTSGQTVYKYIAVYNCTIEVKIFTNYIHVKLY